jgi:hypothetical protein
VYRASRWSGIGLIGDPGPKQYLTTAGSLMEAFTEEGKLVRKATCYKDQRAAALPHQICGLSEPSFRPPMERIGDPKISPTRLT